MKRRPHILVDCTHLTSLDLRKAFNAHSKFFKKSLGNHCFTLSDVFINRSTECKLCMFANLKPDSELDSDPDSELDSDLDSELDPGPDSEPDSDPDSELDPDPDSKLDPDPDSELNSDPDSEPDPDPDSDLDPDPNSELIPDLDPQPRCLFSVECPIRNTDCNPIPS